MLEICEYTIDRNAIFISTLSYLRLNLCCYIVDGPREDKLWTYKFLHWIEWCKDLAKLKKRIAY